MTDDYAAEVEAHRALTEKMEEAQRDRVFIYVDILAADTDDEDARWMLEEALNALGFEGIHAMPIHFEPPQEPGESGHIIYLCDLGELGRDEGDRDFLVGDGLWASYSLHQWPDFPLFDADEILSNPFRGLFKVTFTQDGDTGEDAHQFAMATPLLAQSKDDMTEEDWLVAAVISMWRAERDHLARLDYDEQIPQAREQVRANEMVFVKVEPAP